MLQVHEDHFSTNKPNNLFVASWVVNIPAKNYLQHTKQKQWMMKIDFVTSENPSSVFVVFLGKIGPRTSLKKRQR